VPPVDPKTSSFISPPIGLRSRAVERDPHPSPAGEFRVLLSSGIRVALASALLLIACASAPLASSIVVIVGLVDHPPDRRRDRGGENAGEDNTRDKGNR
jgi:hypothetical protein